MGSILAVLCPVSKPRARVLHELPLGTQCAATAASMCVTIHSPVPVSLRPSAVDGLFSSPSFHSTDLYSPAPSGLQGCVYTAAGGQCCCRGPALQFIIRPDRPLREGFAPLALSISEALWVSMKACLCAAKQHCESASLLCSWRGHCCSANAGSPLKQGSGWCYCLLCRPDLLTQTHKHCPWWHLGWGGLAKCARLLLSYAAREMGEMCWWTGGDLFWSISVCCFRRCWNPGGFHSINTLMLQVL